MNGKRYIYAGAAALTLAATVGLSVSVTQADSPKKLKVPVLQVDPSWPKPLPVAGQFGTPPQSALPRASPSPGSPAKSRERASTRRTTCSPSIAATWSRPRPLDAVPSPTVIEFDSAGNVVNAWGDRTCCPTANSRLLRRLPGQHLDRRQRRRHRRRSTRTTARRCCCRSARTGVCDNPPANTCGNSGGNPAANKSQTLLNEPANMWVDPNPDPVTGQRGSVYIADGYGNHRVVVFNATGDVPAPVGRRGRHGQQSADRLPGALRLRRRRPSALRRRRQRRTDLRVRSRGRPHPGLRQDGRAPAHHSRRSGHRRDAGHRRRAGARHGRLGMGPRASPTTLRRRTCSRSTAATRSCTHGPRRWARSSRNSAQPGHQAGQFTFLHSDHASTRRATSTPARPSTAAASRSSSHVECNNGNGKGNGNGQCS